MEENIINNECQETADVKCTENSALPPEQITDSQPIAVQGNAYAEENNKVTVYCTNCSMPLSYEQRFCPNCGAEQYKLQTGITEEPAPEKKSKGKIIAIIIAIVCSVSVLVGALIISNSHHEPQPYNGPLEEEEEEYAGPDLQVVYNEIGGDDYYCKLGSDESYISIDTNPLDFDDYSSSSAWSMVEELNSKLELPDSLNEKMLRTRALDGTQTATYEYITVSWTYHPDQGLEATYELNNFKAKF